MTAIVATMGLASKIAPSALTAVEIAPNAIDTAVRPSEPAMIRATPSAKSPK